MIDLPFKGATAQTKTLKALKHETFSSFSKQELTQLGFLFERSSSIPSCDLKSFFQLLSFLCIFK